MTTAAELRARFDAAPMSGTQARAVGLTVLLSALDGFDVLSATFAAPAITLAWGIGKGALGVVLSAGLAGMALGAFLLAPLADVIGRKAMVLVALLLMAIGMLMCASAHDMRMLALWRVVTGLGVGSCVAVINPIAAEFANARRRALTVSMMAIGYPLGGVVGGLVAAHLLKLHGWPSVFVAGSIAAVALLPAVLWLLPESPAFLLTRRGQGALERLNAVLTRCGQPPVDLLPPAEATTRGYAAVFAPGQVGATAWITVCNMLFVLTVYYVLSWLPQMVADAGFPPAAASKVSAIASLSGVAGGLLLGWAAQGVGLRILVGGGMVALGLSTAAFGLTPPVLPLLMLSAGVCGFFLFGAASGAYAVLAGVFRDEARASGSGFFSGMGRITSAAAPLIAGSLFASGLSRAQVSIAFAACSLLAGLILFFGWTRFRPS